MSPSEAKHVLLIITAIGFFGVLAALLFFPVPAGNKDFLQMLLMPLAGVFGFLVGYKPPEKKE